MSCASCRHWGRDDAERAADSRLIVLRGGPRREAVHRICDAIGWWDYDYPDELPPPRPVVIDAEHYHAALWTTPEFSCSLFEAQNETKPDPTA